VRPATTCDKILGAAMLGHEASEVITVVQMAMLGGMDYTAVRDAVITHPTMAEGLTLLFTPAYFED
jgi:probable pyridine nucleotide-disulfide oxidoreductase